MNNCCVRGFGVLREWRRPVEFSRQGSWVTTDVLCVLWTPPFWLQVELVVATTPLQIVFVNTKLKQYQMQQHWTDYRNPCIDFVKFVLSNVLTLGVIMRMHGAQIIQWIHLNSQNFATIDYPLVIRINGLWSPILIIP